MSGIICICIIGYAWISYLKSVSDRRYDQKKKDINNLFVLESRKIFRIVQYSNSTEELHLIAGQIINSCTKKYRSRADKKLLVTTMQQIWAAYHNRRVHIIFKQNNSHGK